MLSKLKIKTDKHSLILAIIILFFFSANLAWIKLDRALPMWDQSQYLQGAKVLYSALVREGVLSFLKVFSETFKNKAPLIAALPVPFYIFFGEGYKSALLVNLAFLILGNYYLYRLCTLISGKKEAILSVFILNTLPLAFSLSREFLVDYGLMTFVIIWMFYLVRSDSFAEKKYAIVLGVVLGGGMLMKIGFLLYIVFPTFFLLIDKIFTLKKLPTRYVKNILLTLSIGILISGIWYFKNVSFALSNVFAAGYGDVARNWGTGDVFSIKAVLEYWVSLINHGISAYFFFLFICLMAVQIIVFVKTKSAAGLHSTHFWFLIIWMLFPFIVLTFGVNKEIRFTAPFLPALALLIGISGIQLSRARNYGRYLLFVLLMFPFFNYFFISFYQKPVSVRAGQLILLHNWLSVGHPPITWGHLPAAELSEFVQNDAARTGRKNALTILLFNHPYLNADNLNYYSNGMRFQTLYGTNENMNMVVGRIEREADYIITKSGNVGPEYANRENLSAAKILEAGNPNFKRIGAVLRLPDDTSLTVYKKNVIHENVFRSRKEIRELSGGSVNFSDQIMFLAHRLERTDRGYRLVFFWECLDTISHDYEVFVHFYSSDDRLILNADHRPHAKYPANQWRRGEVIKDELDITSPLPEKFHVYVGLYEGSTGVRLPVKDKPVDDPENVRGVRIL